MKGLPYIIMAALGLLATGLVLRRDKYVKELRQEKKKQQLTPPTFSPKPVKMQLSKNFNLSEMLKSKIFPELKFYQPTNLEIGNARILAQNVLQPLRDRFGVVRINSGGRPPNFKGKNNLTIYQALRKRNYSATKDSDHNYFAAADVSLKSGKYEKAYQFLKGLHGVRQVILHTTQRTGRKPSTYIHVAAIVPGRPKIKGKRFAFVKKEWAS